MVTILETYLDNKESLKRFLRRFLARREDIEDIAQEAFLRAFAAESSQTISNPKAFLFKVAKNLALNEKARMSNILSAPLEDSEGQTVVESGDRVSIDDDVDARQRFRMLAQAVASLPPQCSRVFLLRKVNGLSQKEIAQRLNISTSTVEKHVALGLLRCSEYLRARGCEVNGKAGNPSNTESDRVSSSEEVANLEVKRRDGNRNDR